jgi:hypothetical protein
MFSGANSIISSQPSTALSNIQFEEIGITDHGESEADRLSNH